MRAFMAAGFLGTALYGFRGARPASEGQLLGLAAVSVIGSQAAAPVAILTVPSAGCPNSRSTGGSRRRRTWVCATTARLVGKAATRRPRPARHPAPPPVARGSPPESRRRCGGFSFLLV